jgi:hypothetical protein
MSFLFYLIGIIMISVAVGNMYSTHIGFITLGSFCIFIALFEEVMEYLKNR